MSLSTMLLAGRLVDLTSFFSWQYYVLFLPVCVLIFTLVPKNFKKYFLLIANYCFFWLISGKLIAYLFLTTFYMHYFGLWLDKIQNKMQCVLTNTPKEEKKQVKKDFLTKQRFVVGLATVLLIGTLLTLKYTPFFTFNINTVLSKVHAPFSLLIPKYVMPIGISFFTLQAMSYIIDVYRGTVKADENPFRLALFISFFPQIVEGPICRYSQTAEQIWNVGPIEHKNLSLGLQRFLFGMMKKIVVANRLNPLVRAVFDNYPQYEGGVIAIAAVFYTIQLYMDFSGSMDAVMGVSQIFGISMPENFQRPFFSKTISEFWKRWHISLGTWFKDYVFYPVTTAKKMKKLTSSARKKLGNHFGPLIAGSVALFCVWFSNGLWHGSAWSFIFFGMYHFALILSGNIISPLVKTVNHKLHINTKWNSYKLMQMLRTTILVIIGELFFRANGLRAGLKMFKSMVTQFTFGTISSELLTQLGVDKYDIFIVFVTLVIVLIISILNEKGIIVREALAKKHLAVRWTVIYALLLYIFIFGAYGFGYASVDPLYAQF